MSVSVSSFSVGDANHNNKKLILVTVSTTAGNTMRSGNWTLTLTNTAAASANYDIWTQLSHDDGYPFFPLEAGDAAPARRRNNTVISPATARDAITVANYHGGEIFSSSSRGPATYPAGTPAFEMKPTLAAVGAYVTAARSRATPAPSSCCNQLVVDMNGTSMAAPHVAGVVALIFEKNRNLNFEQVRAHLQHSARKDGIPAAEVPPEVDAGHQISWNNIWGSGKLEAKIALNEVPAASAADPVRAGGGAGGAGGGTISRADVASPDRSSPDTASRDERRWPVAEELGYTPHTIFSRLGEWQRRIGPRPGLMLVASLVSEHVDEILRLINRNNKVGAVWRRHGGPLLVRHLLFGTKTQLTLLPAQVPGCDVRSLIPRFLPILRRFGSARLKADIERFGAFAQSWPGANAALLDQYAAVVAQRAIKGET
jgi:hypothetical protein